ncbi:MAG: hypothetical protein IH977_07030 [Nitrospinae bacterium]|nr:hypothetical protein [Nitrospinota bacterium]
MAFRRDPLPDPSGWIIHIPCSAWDHVEVRMQNGLPYHHYTVHTNVEAED